MGGEKEPTGFPGIGPSTVEKDDQNCLECLVVVVAVFVFVSTFSTAPKAARTTGQQLHFLAVEPSLLLLSL